MSPARLPSTVFQAAKWPETVSEVEKGTRLQRLIALQEEISRTINQGLVGSMTEVLIEGPARRSAGWLAGKTPQYKTAVFPADGSPYRVNDIARIRITDSTAHTLIGRAA